MKQPPLFAVFVHCFYQTEEMLTKLFPLCTTYSTEIFINTVLGSENKDNTALQKNKQLPAVNLIQRTSTNVGKDIGGKLVLIDAWIRLGKSSEFLVLLHDKKSPHKADGRKWFENLSRIVEPPVVEKALEIFKRNKKVGIVASKGAVVNNFGNSTDDPNKVLLEGLSKKFGVYPSDTAYVAGTMFWVRTELLMNFFRRFNALEIRESLEEGNVLDEMAGTNTHSWERFLSWIITSQGYSIEEV